MFTRGYLNPIINMVETSATFEPIWNQTHGGISDDRWCDHACCSKMARSNRSTGRWRPPNVVTISASHGDSKAAVFGIQSRWLVFFGVVSSVCMRISMDQYGIKDKNKTSGWNLGGQTPYVGRCWNPGPTQYIPTVGHVTCLNREYEQWISYKGKVEALYL